MTSAILYPPSNRSEENRRMAEIGHVEEGDLDLEDMYLFLNV